DDSSYDHQRLDLGVKRKVNLSCKAEEFLDFEAPTAVQLKLVVTANRAEEAMIRQSELYQQLLNNGAVIAFTRPYEATEQAADTIQSERKHYLTRLRELIEAQPNTLSWFENLFGSR